MNRYKLAPEIPEAICAKLQDYAPKIQQILYNRAILDVESAQEFINPKFEESLHDPFLMNDMKVAVERVIAAISANEHIVIYSDYDCDGIPGAVVLHDFFAMVGYENFSNYIPHRHYEGFGFNESAAKKLVDKKTKLIITIDCGTNDHVAIKFAQDNGVDVIVTDHHEPPAVLPEAFAVVNPKIGDTYPFKDLCGAGVVFKLITALIQKGDYKIKAGQEKWLLDMVGVATVADMVPLVGENRALAYYGLKVLRKSRRPGLQQLLRIQKANQSYLNEDDIGFTIGPRINAASRMDSPEDAFNLLATKSEVEAGEYAQHIEKLNTERKTAVSLMTRAANKKLKETIEIPEVIVIGNPEWRPSLAGLLANKLAEEYHRPAFVWGRDGNDVIKGSCRSNGMTSIITLMNQTPELFLEFGGHHMSGGFAVSDDNVHKLQSTLVSSFDSLGEEASIKDPIVIDVELNLGDVDAKFIKSIMTMGPFGMGNNKPLFQFSKVTPKDVQVFGKTKEHTKLMFDTKNGSLEAICFFKLPSDFKKEPKINEEIDMIAHIEQSFFMGRMQNRLRIVDIL